MDLTELLELIAPITGGNYIDQQNAKNSVSASDAISGSEAKGIYGTSNRINDLSSLLSGAMNGTNRSSNLTSALNNLSTQANTAVTPPSINQNIRNRTTGTNPLMTTVMNTAVNPAGSTLRSQGLQTLFDRLSQRMGTRNQTTGTLTPA